MNTNLELDNITIFTTFSEKYYNTFGHMWLHSLLCIIKNNDNIRVKIYCEGFTPNVYHPNIEYIDFDSSFPNHVTWMNEYLKSSNHSDYTKDMTIKYSYKAFVIADALKTINDGYAIWIDADCVFKNADYSKFASSLTQQTFLACQVEVIDENSPIKHVESGILIFDCAHQDKNIFLSQFLENYKVDSVCKLSNDNYVASLWGAWSNYGPYDGFIIHKTLMETKIDFIDLNKFKPEIKTMKDPTFMHPELQCRFIHNMAGGKEYIHYESSKLKLNIGSGDKRYEGFINCDHSNIFNPEYVFNLEKDIWPFKDNTVDEVIAHHVLEHMGEGYFHCLKELYRVCKNNAIIDIKVPHYKNENQFHDPTHRRPITKIGFLLFSKKYNREDTSAGSKLGLMYDIDFEIISCEHSLNMWHPQYEHLSRLNQHDLDRFAFDKVGVYDETYIRLKVVK
jgi:hypothetical protein